MKFRKLPVVIEAGRWWGAHADGRPLETNEPGSQNVVAVRTLDPATNTPEVLRLPCDQCRGSFSVHGHIGTWEGGHRVCPGDWIITGVAGEQYPCKPDIFARTYESAEGQ